jgi:hypothetical protein
LMQVNLISSSYFHNPKPLKFFWFIDVWMIFFSIDSQDCVVRSNRNWKECQKGTFFFPLSLYLYVWDCDLGFNISKFLVDFMRKYWWLTHVYHISSHVESLWCYSFLIVTSFVEECVANNKLFTI